MSRKRYSTEQIIGMLRQAEVALSQGRTTGDICREENTRLRRAISDLTLDKLILQEAAKGNF
jgi:hypothetical protein